MLHILTCKPWYHHHTIRIICLNKYLMLCNNATQTRNWNEIIVCLESSYVRQKHWDSCKWTLQPSTNCISKHLTKPLSSYSIFPLEIHGYYRHTTQTQEEFDCIDNFHGITIANFLYRGSEKLKLSSRKWKRDGNLFYYSFSIHGPFYIFL